MATPEEEIKDLQEKNNELVKKVQHWKITAAQRENEKLELMKELNELRLQISRIRSGGAAQARKLDADLQTASEEALNHLVIASGAIARTMELAKAYMRDRQVLDMMSPRWSNISGTPTTQKVRRVPPMMGGQSIQPVVSLSRTILNTSIPRSGSQSPNNSRRNVTERAVPMHMLQDVYIPLTRIDATGLLDHNEDSDPEENNVDDSTEDFVLEDNNEQSLEESQNITEQEFEESRRLDAVVEDIEEDEELETPPRPRTENPLEGPSWLLDRSSSSKSNRRLSQPLVKSRVMLEPDSTTDEESARAPHAAAEESACAFTPTVRRRRRAASPAERPERSPSASGRVLKVLVAKMRLGDASTPKRSRTASPAPPPASPCVSSPAPPPASPRAPSAPPAAASTRKAARMEEPSPNGSTDSRVMVSEPAQEPQDLAAGDEQDLSVIAHDTPELNNVTSRDTREPRGVNVTSRETRDPRSLNVTSRETQEPRLDVTSRETQEPRLDVTSRETQEPRSISVTSRETREPRSLNVTSREPRSTNVTSHEPREPRLDVTSRETQEPRSASVTSRDSGEGRSTSAMSRDSGDSDARDSEGRAQGRVRRPRKAVTYKEKPLNRKMRR